MNAENRCLFFLVQILQFKVYPIRAYVVQKQFQGIHLHWPHIVKRDSVVTDASWALEKRKTSPHISIKWPRREKTCLRGFANNTGADQPARSRSPISAFVIRFL